jgi:hypothetical protein
MRQSSPRIWISFALVTAFCAAARAQAVTEYGSMASRSATVGGKAHRIGDEIGGVWKGLDARVKGAPEHADSQGTPPSGTAPRPAVRSRQAHAGGAPMARKNYEDPTGISPGMGYEELVRRFGPPSFGITTGATKTLTYLGKNGGVDLELQDGKVVRVTTPKPPQIAAASPK